MALNASELQDLDLINKLKRTQNLNDPVLARRIIDNCMKHNLIKSKLGFNFLLDLKKVADRNSNIIINNPRQDNNILNIESNYYNPNDVYTYQNDYVIAKPADRFLAYILDYLLMLPAYIALGIEFYFLYLVVETYDAYKYYSSSTALYYVRNVERLESLRIGAWADFNQYKTITQVLGLITCIYSLIMLIIFLVYYSKGTSPGKKAMKMVVVDKETGVNLSLGKMLLRDIGKIISNLILYLGFIWILIDKENQGWHDKLCSSVVIKTNIRR